METTLSPALLRVHRETSFMRFLHAADIHLDSPLRGLDEYEGAPVQALRAATRKAFSALIELALAERVAFVILAGDLYDGDWPDYNTGLFFVNRVRELDRAGIPLVLLTGNHDAASRITARLTLPPNVRVFPTAQPGTICFDDLRVALHGQGFDKQAELRNLAVQYPAPVPGYLNVGVLHTALDGREGHDPYAPCTMDDLIARRYDYWALGHIHKRESVNGDRYPRIEFPGNLQGRHVREAGAKGCLLVTVDEKGQAVPEFRALDVFRWQTVTVQAAAAESTADVVESARVALCEARDGTEGRPLAARLVISCPESVGHCLAAELEQIRADLRGQSGSDVWIEKIKLAPIDQVQVDEPTLSEDAASELRAVLRELREQPDDTRAILSTGDCGKLMNRLPRELRAALEQSLDDVFALASALLQARP
jgi:DNA repair exonuclease SbcCD nuclease subunit